MVGDHFNILSHPLRRRLLFELFERDEGAELSIPDVLVADRDDRGRVRTDLVHTHLPKLEAAELIEWDRDEDTVTRGPEFDEIEPLLALFDEHADDLPYEWP